MSDQGRKTELVPEKLTPEEEARLKTELVERLGDVYTLRGKKKVEGSAINAQIAEAEKLCSDLQEVLHAGFRMIEVPVEVIPNEPKAGMKKIVRADNMDTIRIESMTPMERQDWLFPDPPSAGDDK